MRLDVDRASLLEILRENRSKHHQIYEEAIEGYRDAALRELESQIDSLKADDRKPVEIYFRLQRPTNQLADYDRVIGLLNMSDEAKVPLSDVEYASYVLDQWSWRNQFIASNRMYSSTAAQMAAAEGEDE